MRINLHNKPSCDKDPACPAFDPDRDAFTPAFPSLHLLANLDLLKSVDIVTANIPHMFARSSPPPVYDGGATALSDSERTVTKFYAFLLDRLPDLGGLHYWASELDAGKSAESVVASIFNAAYASTIYSDFAANADFITAAYWHVLGRSPDAEGAAYWLGQMPDTSVASRLGILQNLMDAAFAAENGSWALTFAQDRLASCSEAVAQQLATDYVFSGQLLQIDCYGDSTSFGYDGAYGTRVSLPMPETLQLELNLQLPAPVIVNNFGVNSTTAADLLNGSGGHQPFAARLAASTADVIVFNFGLNEAYRGNSQQAMHDTLAELVRMVQAAGKHAIISTTNPVTPEISWQAQVADMYAGALQVAQETTAMTDDEYAAILNLPGWPDSLSDGVHPVQALYTTKAAQLATEILLSPNELPLEVIGLSMRTDAG